MRLIGMMPCRNEDWILGLSARAALMWCDALVILNHASTDGTWEIIEGLIEEFPDRVLHVINGDAEWPEMAHRQAILTFSRNAGATHLAIVDADEVLTGNLLGSIRTHVESMPPGRILQLPLYNLRCGLDRCHANGIWAQGWLSTAFQDEPRMGWSGDRFHHREPADCMPFSRPVARGDGGVMHLWGANERRLRAKHAFYKMTEAMRWPNKSHAEIERIYNQAFVPSANSSYDQNWQYALLPAEWWAPYKSLLPGVNLDATPWQEEACRSLYAEYGPDRFAGLDLLDVCASEVIG